MHDHYDHYQMGVFDVDMLCVVKFGSLYLVKLTFLKYIFFPLNTIILCNSCVIIASDANSASNMAQAGPRAGFRTAGFHIC